jgi:hypothetical protein
MEVVGEEGTGVDVGRCARGAGVGLYLVVQINPRSRFPLECRGAFSGVARATDA